jgi:hypothetical protein
LLHLLLCEVQSLKHTVSHPPPFSFSNSA